MAAVNTVPIANAGTVVSDSLQHSWTMPRWQIVCGTGLMFGLIMGIGMLIPSPPHKPKSLGHHSAAHKAAHILVKHLQSFAVVSLLFGYSGSKENSRRPITKNRSSERQQQLQLETLPTVLRRRRTAARCQSFSCQLLHTPDRSSNQSSCFASGGSTPA